MSITPADPPELKRQFPHVDDIADWRAKQSIRLLWERVFDLEARLQAATTTVGDLVNATNRQDDAITLADRKADEALAITQQVEQETAETGGSGPVVSGPLVWAWIDMKPTGAPGVAPGSPGGAPATMTDWQNYFYGLTGIPTIGDPADDYEDKMLDLVAAGMKVNPVPWEIPSAAWPFFGLSVMIDAGGHPRGRIWLPTAVPDSLGYYTHEIQFIDAAP